MAVKINTSVIINISDNDNVWRHFALVGVNGDTSNNSSYYCYVNGILKTARLLSPYSADIYDYHYLGAGNGNINMVGWFNDFKIYSIALSNSDISSNYYPTVNLTISYKMEHDLGNLEFLKDSKGSYTNLTIGCDTRQLQMVEMINVEYPTSING